MKSLLLLLLTLTAIAPASLPGQIRVKELSGRWKYNEARSDRLRDKLPPDPYFGTMPSRRRVGPLPDATRRGTRAGGPPSARGRCIF